VLPTGTRPQPPALDPQHRILFAQRLAVLIKRIRAATKEGNSNER
jgi:hypothetical protein